MRLSNLLPSLTLAVALFTSAAVFPATGCASLGAVVSSAASENTLNRAAGAVASLDRAFVAFISALDRAPEDLKAAEDVVNRLTDARAMLISAGLALKSGDAELAISALRGLLTDLQAVERDFERLGIEVPEAAKDGIRALESVLGAV